MASPRSTERGFLGVLPYFCGHALSGVLGRAAAARSSSLCNFYLLLSLFERGQFLVAAWLSSLARVSRSYVTVEAYEGQRLMWRSG